MNPLMTVDRKETFWSINGYNPFWVNQLLQHVSDSPDYLLGFMAGSHVPLPWLGIFGRDIPKVHGSTLLVVIVLFCFSLGSSPRLPDGLVIANDMEIKRCNLLTHQMKRLQSPCVVVTNHDASIMPNVALNDESQEKLIDFDRILCDVHCSGKQNNKKL